jgi:hypothetical protein
LTLCQKFTVGPARNIEERSSCQSKAGHDPKSDKVEITLSLALA